VKIFDPRDSSTRSHGANYWFQLLSKETGGGGCTLLAGPKDLGATDIFSALLAVEAPLSVTGWEPTRETTGELAPVAGQQRSKACDGNGGGTARPT
jgi:hypothetical protein